MVLAHDISKGDRTNDVKITQNITFETMLLAPNTLQGLKDSGFYKPSPIQLYGIPIGKCGFDLLLEAKSGTGKTAVFTIIALEQIDFCKGLQVVILTPTREIASQVCDVLKQIGSRYKELQVEVVMGGLPIQDDIKKLKKPVHILVGSPGRVRHIIQNKYVDIKSVRLLVLDEADKLMEGSFQSDVKYIHNSLPKQKQIIMSSATYPQRSLAIINKYMPNASHVCPDSDCVLLGIQQKVSIVRYNNNIVRQTQERFKELLKILGRLQFKQCLVFCNYQVRVSDVHNLLKRADWPSQDLYGQQEQVHRLDALRTLQQYKCRILVSTDLAARGIDASNVDLVVNFEPPYDWQTYLHRIGRSGRFGSYGLAITLLSEGKEEQRFKEIFKSNLSINMRHLWSDTEFEINSSRPNTPPERCISPAQIITTVLPQKELCSDVWKLLSGKTNVLNNDSIETFNSECKVSENAEAAKIVPFSELMLSLEDNVCQGTDENIAFKHIEMTKTSTDALKDTENSVTENDFKKVNVDDVDNIRYDTEHERNAASTDAFENIDDNNINTTATEKHKTYNQRAISKMMLNLDLPVKFSSSKGKTRDPSRIPTQKINKTTFENIKHSRNVNKKKVLMENYVTKQLENYAETPATNCDIGGPYNSNLYNENENHYGKGSRLNYRNNVLNNDYESDCLNEPLYGSFKHSHRKSNLRKNTLQSRFEQEENMKLYSSWYTQLKIRTQYIEQAVYVHEMSKL